MEDTSIKQFLKSFCDNSHWKYAVFWKLNQQVPMTLIWEDGYCNYQKTNAAVESMSSDVKFKGVDEIFSLSCESNGSLADYSARLLMTEMSNLEYNVGEGVVGKIAVTGEHFWVFCEDIFTSKFSTNLIPECPYEWLLQFASDIKTIVLVPVLPQGVLQFGSTKAVSEDLAFVAYIKEKFSSIHCMPANTTPLSSDINIQAQSFSTITHSLMDNFDESSITDNILKSELSDSISPDITQTTWLSPTVPSFIQDKCFMSEKAQPKFLERSNKNDICFPSNEIYSYLDEDLVQQFGDNDINHKDCKNLDSFLSFPLDCELQEALGPVNDRLTAESMPIYFSLEDMCNSSCLITNEKGFAHMEDLKFPNDSGAQYLLDVVIGNLHNASDDTSSGISNSVVSSVTLQKESTCSIQPQSHSEESSLMVDISDPRSDLTSEFVAGHGNDLRNPLTSVPFDGEPSLLIDDKQQEMIYGDMEPNRGLNFPSRGKKRARVGNMQSPRPRDRQLVMDRMKELRELVPDSAKCSIDNLLDRTIKHMLYLRNMTNRAEKLKQCKPQEVPECKKRKTNGNHAGRSCAFDLESELQVCPIIIEDLECPGHMLIEMICSDHGIFLEIAQVIRQMDLTILKGVLESHSSATTSARFIVEAPKGFHRMDVLCPLLHYLQLRRNNLSSLI